LTVEGRTVLSVGQAPMINHCVIGTDYFRAMGIPLLAGRDFTDADADGAVLVTIINETLAREFFPNEDPLGKRVRFGPPEDNEPWHTIVGVAKDVRHDGLDAGTRRGIYVAHPQKPVGGMTLVLRAAVDPSSLVPAVRAKVLGLDRQVPLTNVRSMEQVVARSVWQPRLYTALFGVFAAVAVILAAGGIYGVISYAVEQRTHEIGIRLALGARPRDVVSLVVRQGMLPALVGIGIGLGGALLLTRLMASLLYSVGATDPLTFAGVALLLAGVALLACYVPARRATRVDPVVALRNE
jgi:putative ABC transport system permease protein